MRTPRSALALLLAAAAVAAGCGTETLDTGKAEDEIARGIERDIGATDVTVDCPDDVEVKKGDKFQCDAKAAGDDAKVEVEQLDEEGNVRWRLER